MVTPSASSAPEKGGSLPHSSQRPSVGKQTVGQTSTRVVSLKPTASSSAAVAASVAIGNLDSPSSTPAIPSFPAPSGHVAATPEVDESAQQHAEVDGQQYVSATPNVPRGGYAAAATAGASAAAEVDASVKAVGRLYKPTRLLAERFEALTGRILPALVPFLPFNTKVWTENLYVSTLFLSYSDPESAFYNERFQFRRACLWYKHISLISTENGQIVVFEGLCAEEKKEWSEGFLLSPLPATQANLTFKDFIIPRPNISSFSFLSHFVKPTEDAVMVRTFTRHTEKGVETYPHTWMVSAESCEEVSIPSSVLLSNHKQSADKLATLDFPFSYNYQKIKERLDAITAKVQLRFLVRGNSVRVYTPTGFTDASKELLRKNRGEAILSWDIPVPRSIPVVLNTDLSTPFTASFLDKLGAHFGFVPSATRPFSATNALVCFSAHAAIDGAAEQLGPAGIHVSRLPGKRGTGKERIEEG